MSQLKNIKMSVAHFHDVVPSTNASIKITPFRVGDEKILLMASESKDAAQMASALKQVVDNCTIGVEGPLAFFDYEYLFIKLRAVSVGESTTIGINCPHCNATNKVTVDMSKIKVKKNDKHTRTIKVSDELAFAMKYPDIEKAMLVGASNGMDGIINLICESVDSLYAGEEVIKIGPAEKSDLKGLIEDMNGKQFAAFRNFFETMPKLSETVHYGCTSCGQQNEQVLEGLQSFF